MSKQAHPLARHGRLSYLEIPASDGQKSAVFYTQIFGWRIDDRGGGDWRFSDGDGGLIGRFARDRVPSREAGWMPVVYVDDIELAVSRAPAHGGQVVKPPYREGDVHVAWLRDPAGNLLGVWQFG